MLRWKGRPYLDVAGGLYDMRARWWSPTLGNFLTVDGFEFHAPDTTLWSWPSQNPIHYSDPTGHYAEKDPCTGELIVPVEFQSDKGLSEKSQRAQLERMMNALQNSASAWRNAGLKLRVVDVTGRVNPYRGTNLVSIVKTLPPTERGEIVLGETTYGSRGANGFARGQMNLVDKPSLPTTATHELGHALGYNNEANVSDPGHSADPHSIMHPGRDGAGPLGIARQDVEAISKSGLWIGQ